MSFKSTSVRTVQYLMACLNSVSYLLGALWVSNMPPSSRAVLGLTSEVCLLGHYPSRADLGPCKMVLWVFTFKISFWFGPSPGSVSDMVLTGVLDCPLLPRDLMYWNSCRPCGVVETLYIEAICKLQSAIKMGSVIICVLQKTIVITFRGQTDSPHISHFHY